MTPDNLTLLDGYKTWLQDKIKGDSLRDYLSWTDTFGRQQQSSIEELAEFRDAKGKCTTLRAATMDYLQRLYPDDVKKYAARQREPSAAVRKTMEKPSSGFNSSHTKLNRLIQYCESLSPSKNLAGTAAESEDSFPV